jgi:hypothetical protein
MKIIVAQGIVYPDQHDHTHGHAKRKPKDVDRREEFILEQASPGHYDVILKHMWCYSSFIPNANNAFLA